MSGRPVPPPRLRSSTVSSSPPTPVPTPRPRTLSVSTSGMVQQQRGPALAMVAAAPPALPAMSRERLEREEAGDKLQLGVRILELARFIRDEDEQEASRLRDCIKRGPGSRTPRGERSLAWRPVAPARVMSKSPRPPLPPSLALREGISATDETSSSASASGDESFALQAADDEPAFKEELRTLDLATFVLQEEERARYEEREAVKRSKSKTPRNSKSVSHEPVAPRRLSHISPRPHTPSLSTPNGAVASKKNKRVTLLDDGSSSSESDDERYQSVAREVMAEHMEQSVQRLVERSLGRALPEFTELSSTTFTVLLVRVGPQQLLQVTLMERGDGTMDVTQCTEIPTDSVRKP